MKDLRKIAILCIHQDYVRFIEKCYGYRHHVEFFIDLSKTDSKVQEILSRYDINYLLKHPNEIYNTVVKDLICEGSCLLINYDIRTIAPTEEFYACMPEKINDFQKNILEVLRTEYDYKFFYFDVFDSNKNNSQNIMQKEDQDKKNFYLLDEYIKLAYFGLKK